MIEWQWPWLFVLLPLPLLVRMLLPPLDQQDNALTVPDLKRFTLATKSNTKTISRRWSTVLVLLTLAWGCLVTAAARPQWTGAPVSLPTSGRDLMLAVDISGSMSTEDLQLQDQMVNRLLVVKSVVNSFLQTRQGDRVGLILFGTNAYLQAPLTFDLNSVSKLLAEAPVGIAGGKTAIGDAIGLAVKRLRQRPDDGDRVLILLTDGANNVGEVAPIKAAELAASEEIKIYTIGVGADEMQLKMPGLFGSLGSRIVNPSAELDVETLEKIAQLTNGEFYRARNTAKLQEIYAIIDQLEPAEQDAEVYRPITSLFHWPLSIGWLLLLCTIALQWWQSKGSRSAHA